MEHESVIVVTNVGPQGPRGEKGDTAITVAVGTVTTGAPGTSASVVNSGTAKDMVLDFTIPQGDKGDQGVPGQDGHTPIIITATTTDPGEGSPLADNTLLVVYDDSES